MKRLGFLGAMNRDIVAECPAAPLLGSLGVDAEPLIETAVPDALAQQGAERLLAMGGAIYLGGSAFNAARIAALLNDNSELDLTFFGIAGTIGAAVPHRQALTQWGIAADWVSDSPLPPATCLAMVEPAGRTLLTAPGANAGIAAWLRTNMADLALAAADCDIIHVTSFLDPAAPMLIAELIARARAHNPDLILSLDPGMAWIGPGGEGLDSLLAQTGILHLNHEEMALLQGSSSVADIGVRLRPFWSIVARSHEGATIYAQAADGQVTQASQPPRPLPATDAIVDATGAGDTFCGAFLWSWCRNSRPLDAAALGFALARMKIGMNGPLAMNDDVREVISAHTNSASW